MPEGVALQIQCFGNANDQTLVVLHVASLRSDAKTASPSEVQRTFIDLRIPPPRKVSNQLASLASKKLVLSPTSGRWVVSALGERRIRELMESVSDSDLIGLLAVPEDALLADIPHSLLPAEMAPSQFAGGIARFLAGHPFENNVFGITRLHRKTIPSDPMPAGLEACRVTCATLGLEYHLATDRAVEELLLSNIVAAMWACRYGIAIIEDTVGEGVNYNVPLEVGAMLVTGRPCLLLKDKSVKKPPSDLVAHLYDDVDLDDPTTIAAAVQGWAKHRLGLG